MAAIIELREITKITDLKTLNQNNKHKTELKINEV